MQKSTKAGQLMIMFIFVLMAMLSFVYLIINLGNLSIAKVKLQKAVDSAALAMATYQARAFNSIADKNYILKYPSGDKNLVYPDTYSFPGIDQVDRSTNYKFRGTGDYETYFRMIAPHQNQQDKFAKIYATLVPKLAENFALKNDPTANLKDQQFSNLSFEREYVNVRFTNTEDVSKLFQTDMDFNHLQGWMTHANNYMYALVTLNKPFISMQWNQPFLLEAIALADVVAKDGQLWPEPKPEYKSRLSPTQEEGVMH